MLVIQSNPTERFSENLDFFITVYFFRLTWAKWCGLILLYLIFFFSQLFVFFSFLHNNNLILIAFLLYSNLWICFIWWSYKIKNSTASFEYKHTNELKRKTLGRELENVLLEWCRMFHRSWKHGMKDLNTWSETFTLL